jgi:hypothetical protein
VTVALVAPVVAAVAALAAAALSGLTLYVAGRRETRKWLRETLVEALTQFLDASFERPGRHIYQSLRTEPAIDIKPDDYRKQSDNASDVQKVALTKIRLLASRPVVQAAETLHKIENETAALVFDYGSTESDSEWAQLRAARRAAREALISEARNVLGLDESAPISEFG